MEGIYAARAVPLAGQLVDMAGLRGWEVAILLALACDRGAAAVNKTTRHPTSNGIKSRVKRVVRGECIDFTSFGSTLINIFQNSFYMCMSQRSSS